MGLNLSRACTLAYDEKLSVGRVQTPTLAMLVERERQIAAFKKTKFYELVARLRDSARESGFDYEGTAEVELRPGENYVVDFRSELGGFLFGPNRETGVAESKS